MSDSTGPIRDEKHFAQGVWLLIVGAVVMVINSLLYHHFKPTSDLCNTVLGNMAHVQNTGSSVECGVANFFVQMHTLMLVVSWIMLVCGVGLTLLSLITKADD